MNEPNEAAQPREHTRPYCWCGHERSSHVDRSSGILCGNYSYVLACLDCEALVTARPAEGKPPDTD